MSEHKPLTDMQQQFVTNYVTNGFNARQAALDAGYAESYAMVKAPRLVANHPVVKEKIKRAHEVITHEFEEKLGITLEQKMRVLARIVYDIIPAEGEIKHKWLKQGISALSELSKMQGHYAPDRRLQVNVDVTKERLEQASKVYEEF